MGHWGAGGRVQADSTSRHAREGGEGVCVRASTQKTVSWGNEHVHLFIPPLLLRRVGTPSAVDAFLAAGAPRVPDSGAPIAAATARPARARDWARARDPARCRTLLDAPAGGTDLRRLSMQQLQLQCTAKHATRRSPPATRVRRPARTALWSHRTRAPPHPPAASCAMHCTPLAQDLQGHAPHLRLRAHSSRTHALLPRGK